MIASTPNPPYYAVIFTSIRTKINTNYNQVSKEMEDLARDQPGFLGIETARNNIGITVSYWKDLVSIKSWKNNIKHTKARESGRSTWYKSFKVRICKVETEYGFTK